MLRSRLKRFLFLAGIGMVIAFSQSSKCAYATPDNNVESSAAFVSHYLIGLIHDWNGETEDALAEYQKAEKFDHASYGIHLKLGTNYARLGKVKEATQELKTAAELNPEDLQAHYILALVYSSEQDFDKAAGEYETILKHFSKLDPKNVEVYSYLGQLYYSQKKYDKAIEQFQYILTLEPKNAEVLFMLGSVYLDTNDRKKAVGYFKKTVEIDPEHQNGLNSLGYMYAEDGVNLDEAVTMIKKALELDPDNGAYLDSLGWAYFKKGMNKEALDYLTKASTLYKDPVIFDHLGDIYYKLNQVENAEKSWKKSLELLPSQESVRKKLAGMGKDQQVSK